ncbi:MAG: aspartate/methionine/tyrosine aminotransferase [Halobacteriales archaeon]|jgi:aspartate/methionine/tyrosine aminotransferase
MDRQSVGGIPDGVSEQLPHGTYHYKTVFPTIDYLEWMWGRPSEATHDLGSSDLHGGRDGSGPIPNRLRNLDDPEGITLEEQLASIYDVDGESVLVTAGASTANALATAGAIERTTADPRALIEKPGYEPLVATPQGFGAAIDRFERPAATAYPLDPERIGNALTPSTALVTVTNRHNPSGRAVSRKTLGATAESVADSGACFLVDEVYSPFVLADSVRDGPFGGVSAVGLENTAITGSLTKFLGLGGLRVGWVIGDPSVIEDVRRIAPHFPAVADPSRKLGRRALAHWESLATETRTHLERNYDRLTTFIESRDDIEGSVFEGTSFAFVSHEDVDGTHLSEKAWEAGVLVVPGRFFGDESAVRISLGGSPATMDAGLAAFGKLLDSL